MNITLKNVKYMASLSEETHCYSADVWIDGKKMFGMKNAGHGGCDEVYRIKGGVDNVWETYHAIDEDLGKEMSPQSDHAKELGLDPLPNCLEFVVCDLVNDWLRDKEIKRCLKKVCYVKDGDVYVAKHKATPEHVEGYKNVSWFKEKNCIMLNDMPIEEVRKYF